MASKKKTKKVVKPWDEVMEIATGHTYIITYMSYSSKSNTRSYHLLSTKNFKTSVIENIDRFIFTGRNYTKPKLILFRDSEKEISCNGI